MNILSKPSKTIALGFEQNLIETTGGETFIGMLRQETAEAFTRGLKLEDFTDLLVYLEPLK